MRTASNTHGFPLPSVWLEFVDSGSYIADFASWTCAGKRNEDETQKRGWQLPGPQNRALGRDPKKEDADAKLPLRLFCGVNIIG